MFDGWSPTALLVHGAALTYVIGFLVRDQLALRGLLQIGSVLYIAYYYFEPATPLWDAIAWTTVMFLANAFTIWRIVSDRRLGQIDDDDLILHSAIPHIAPGDFRRLMAKGDKKTAAVRFDLTTQGRQPRNLWFLLSGSASIEKTSGSREIKAPMFVGEIAYLLNCPASATVTIAPGTRYVKWTTESLADLRANHDGIAIALEAAFNRDLATKLAAS